MAKSFLMIYLIFAVPGIFVFSIAETIRLDDTIGNRTDAGVNSPLKEFTMDDWTAVEVIQITKTRDTSSSSFRNEIIRELTLSGANISAASYKKSYFPAKITENDNIVKNNIPLKLLI